VAIIPVINVGCLILCIIALFLLLTKKEEGFLLPHIHKRSLHRLGEIRHSSLRLGVFLIEAGACIIRLVYCLRGALFSKRNSQIAGTIILQQGSFPMEVVVSLMATMLFVRWNSFKIKNVESTIRWVKLWIVLVAVVPCCSMLIYARGILGIDVMLTAMVVELIIFEAISTTLFVRYGLGLIKELGPAKDSVVSQPDWKTRSFHWAVRWVIMSSFMKVVSLSGVCVALRLDFWLTPNGYSTCLFLMLFGCSGQALTQVLAFMPSTVLSNRRSSDTAHKKHTASVAVTVASTGHAGAPRVIIPVTSTNSRTAFDAASNATSLDRSISVSSDFVTFAAQRQDSIKRKKEKTSASRQDLYDKRRVSNVPERNEEDLAAAIAAAEIEMESLDHVQEQAQDPAKQASEKHDEFMAESEAKDAARELLHPLSSFVSLNVGGKTDSSRAVEAFEAGVARRETIEGTVNDDNGAEF
jgi:hypothetical protein